MTSQAVYCLSLQIRPTADEGNASAASNGNEQQLQVVSGGVKSVSAASASSVAVVASSAAGIVTTAPTMVTAGGALISGLEKSGVTISAEASRALQSHAIQIQQSHIVPTGTGHGTVTVASHHQPQQHSNIILVRGSRSENGQIILQNTHELLSLLGDSEDKPIFLQHQRLTTQAHAGTTVTGKAATTTTTIAAKTLSADGTTGGSTILFQPAIKDGTGTILLQAQDALKKATGATLDVSGATQTTGAGTTTGPIFLQQRLSKNGTEGPILLRTLKRLDKSQSILVIRNATTTTSGGVSVGGATATAVSAASAGLSVSTAGGATLAKVKPISTPTTTVVTVSAAAAAAAGVGAGGSVASGGSVEGGASALKAARVAAELEGKEKKDAITSSATASTATTVKVVHKSNNTPLGTDGEPIKLPDNLESLPRADHFPTQRHRWNTNEEIAAILISFDKHSEWQSKEVKTRPKSGSMLLYSRKKVRYRRDGYCWKKRKDGKTTREDHMKLKVQGTECIYGCYVHSAILPTFHRRCYWLLQNPDIVLVHYLNVPYPDDNKMAVITPNLALWGDKKEWTKEELVSQLKPMFFPTVFSEDEPDTANEIEISTAETVETIVSQLMEKQRMARQTALVKQLECGCPDASCADGKSCSHPMRRISAAKSVQELQQGKRGGAGGNGGGGPSEGGGHIGGTAPNVLIGSRMYPRWLDNRRMATGRVEQQQQQQQQHSQHNTILDPNGARAITPKTLDTSMHFQVIPTSSQAGLSSQNSIRASNQSAAAHLVGQLGGNPSSQLTSVSSHITNGLTVGQPQANHLTGHRPPTMIITSNQHQPQQQQQHHPQQQQQQHHHPQQHQQQQQQQSHPHAHHGHPPQQQQQHQQQHSLTMNGNSNSSNVNQLSAIGHSNQVSGASVQSATSASSSSSAASGPTADHKTVNGGSNGNENHIPQPTNAPNRSPHQRELRDSAGATSGGSNGGVVNGSVSGNSRVGGSTVVTSTPPLVLSLSQNMGQPGSLLILNGQQQQQQQSSYVCQSNQHPANVPNGGEVKDASDGQSVKTETPSKHEMMDASSSPVQSTLSHRQSSTSSSSCTTSATTSEPATTTTTGSTSTCTEKHSFESIFGYQEHHHHQQSVMASPVRGGLAENGGASATATQHHDNLPFFNETLDLSQEDIQKTLTANMPLGGHVGTAHDTSTPTDDAMNGEINPMDFIESCVDNHGGTVDDDVFVNLDAFDMLVEFPELELDAKSDYLRESSAAASVVVAASVEQGGRDATEQMNTFKLTNGTSEQQQQQQKLQAPAASGSTITDFSPEWAYPEGGIKVLVTGPWSTSSSYSVLFDSFPVPTTLVQDGVLRCYCPAHEVGVVTLQVACDGFVISNAVNFEYKSPPKFETKCEGNGNDMLYRFNLLNRLESIDEKLQIKVEPGELPEDTLMYKQHNFEDRLVSYCETLTSKMWRSVTPSPFIDKHRGMTLLHLAAALGYAKLVRTMLTWKAENSNVILEAEIDALSQDKEGHTPLTLACARGHTETAIMLYKWNQNALNVRTNAQKSPVEIALDHGHPELARELERQEAERKQLQQRTPTSASIPTLASITSSSTVTPSKGSGAATTTGASAASESNHSSSSSSSSPSASPPQSSCSSSGAGQDRKAAGPFAVVDQLGKLNESSGSNSNSSSSSSSSSSNGSNAVDTAGDGPGDSGKSADSNNNSVQPGGHGSSSLHDGSMHHFLTLNQIFSYGEGGSDSCSNDNFGLVTAFNQSLSPNALSPYSDMKGSCSSSGSQLVGGGGGGGCSSSQTGTGGLHYGLENTNSNPMLSNALSPNSDSNRSHDGVFLRPGAVYSSQSPPGARLSKRSSIDSGINMESRSGGGLSGRSGKSFRDAQRLNRTDRSMSLPLGSGSSFGLGSGGSGKSIASSSATEREADSFSLSLSERTTESPSQISSNTSLLSPLRKMDFALWDSDAKVLTLAEQIIAAMPERIKNESEETMYLGSPLPESLNEDTSGMGILSDTFMQPLLDSLPSSQFDQEFNFEFSDHNYRYHDVGTPCSSLSPASSGPLQSPASYSIPQDHPVGSPSPPPTTQDFTEFLQSSNTAARPFEADFSNLKLNDREQRELYEAAKCIQKAYRSYKGRKSRMEEQDKERTAAVVIQNYYRRYKQYAYYRQMTQAALIIQNGYRSYCENKRFKKSQSAQQNQQPETSIEEDKASSQCIETYYQNYRNEQQQQQQQQQQSPQQQQQNNQHSGSSSKEPSPSGPLKRTYSQRTQNQAARKIQQFMRQSKNKLQRERVEKERLVHLRRGEYLQSLQYHEQPEAQPTSGQK